MLPATVPGVAPTFLLWQGVLEVMVASLAFVHCQGWIELQVSTPCLPRGATCCLLCPLQSLFFQNKDISEVSALEHSVNTLLAKYFTDSKIQTCCFPNDPSLAVVWTMGVCMSHSSEVTVTSSVLESETVLHTVSQVASAEGLTQSFQRLSRTKVFFSVFVPWNNGCTCFSFPDREIYYLVIVRLRSSLLLAECLLKEHKVFPVPCSRSRFRSDSAAAPHIPVTQLAASQGPLGVVSCWIHLSVLFFYCFCLDCGEFGDQSFTLLEAMLQS